MAQNNNIPPEDELNLIFKNLKRKGLGSLSSGTYWSSSEYSGAETYGALLQDFSSGEHLISYDKFNTHYVRAVRAF